MYFVHACTYSDKCNKTAPQHGQIVSESYASTVDTSIPGEEIMFTCDPGFSPQTLMNSTCHIDGTWNPDPSGVLCHFGRTMPSDSDDII